MDKTEAAVAVFDKYASFYQQKYMDVSAYGAALDAFCAQIEKRGAEVLEIACGPGNITRYMLDKRPDLKILATDLSPNMLDIAAKTNPEASFQLLDARKIDSLGRTYDAIMCGFCLPYLSKEDALKLIADCATLLNTNGVLYISTMEDNYENSRMQRSSKGDEVFVYYHEGAYLSEVLEKNGFTILELRRQDYLAEDGSKLLDLIIIGRK